jgi:prevent-host-death family protein
MEVVMEWQLAEAKNRFSEVVTRALTMGPQRIRRRGEVVVLLSEQEYLRLTGERPSLMRFILDGPDLSGLDLERDRDTGREIDLQ